MATTIAATTTITTTTATTTVTVEPDEPESLDAVAPTNNMYTIILAAQN